MEHLFEVIGNTIIKLIQQTTSSMNIWDEDYNANVDMLKTCKRACNKWIKICEQLTVLYWPNYSHNKWISSKYLPENLISFSDHINEVCINKHEQYLLIT